ncbi:hypothetical protein N7532_010291 [Penicillium argentinense]|uniref:Uncharacterized protein n=1 Tax=Penicillium argentinense TaxID=1131581 RepID=A0A9W9EPI5_9EURO|nr:uncharacterized protein N7532_010291 [Penicillium argentinense]KAJ5085520.1 hypothetical protein N7532_010291 [Penicillium argentinense]
MERQYGAPYIVVHRAVLHNILHRHAVHSGEEIMLDSQVVKYDFEAGINSTTRSQLLQEADPDIKPTGWAAFRMMAEISKIKEYPEMTDLGIDILQTRTSGLHRVGPV